MFSINLYNVNTSQLIGAYNDGLESNITYIRWIDGNCSKESPFNNIRGERNDYMYSSQFCDYYDVTDQLWYWYMSYFDISHGVPIWTEPGSLYTMAFVMKFLL